VSSTRLASHFATNNCNPYRRGRRFEYRTRNYLRKLGWFVIRQARSSFPDLIALRGDSILLVECKLAGRILLAQRRRIARLTRRQVRGKAILAFRKGREVKLTELSHRCARLDKPFDLGHGESFAPRSWKRR
jgi:Holliday junction resolvase